MVGERWFSACSMCWRRNPVFGVPSRANSLGVRSSMAESTLPKPKVSPICSRPKPKSSAGPRCRWRKGACARRSTIGGSESVDLSAQAEAAIDYVDNEDETGIDAARLANQASAIADEIDSILASPRAEPLKEGIRVVLGGPPNAGKSSLLNALVESDRAIVTDIPGTTRDSIDVPVTMGGIPFVLVDTAGLRDSNDVIEQIGIARAERELLSADILLWLGEGAEMPAHPSLVRIRTKIDLKPKLHQSDSALQLSSVTGEGIDLLWKTIVNLAGEYLPSPTQMALNRRQRDALAVVATALRITKETDIVLAAHGLRTANDALDRLTGRAGIDDMLDALFGRFCLGK